jgi:hypothetical protein
MPGQKEFFVFLHAAKSGGSSFWHSLAPASAENDDIAIADAYHESVIRYGNENHQIDASRQVIEEFLPLKKQKLLLHFHSMEQGLNAVIPPDYSRTYILLLRDERQRLESAYKWYLQTEVFKEMAETEQERNNFFEVFLSKGYSYMLPAATATEICEDRRVTEANSGLLNILIITLDDYNKASDSKAMRTLAQRLGIQVPLPIVFKDTVSGTHPIKAKLPERDDLIFWERFRRQECEELAFLLSMTRKMQD